MFDVLIIGGGVAGISCALVLGSAHQKPFVQNKKIGIILHQKSSDLQDAVFNNAFGIAPGTLGSELLNTSSQHLATKYPHIEKIMGEKVMAIEGNYPKFKVITNKNTYAAKSIVLAIGQSNTFAIEGLMDFVISHKKALPSKQRIQLINEDHLVKEGMYVAGTLAGWRSQLSIAAGSGAAVATDILTLWNDNVPAQSHDSIKK